MQSLDCLYFFASFWHPHLFGTQFLFPQDELEEQELEDELEEGQELELEELEEWQELELEELEEGQELEELEEGQELEELEEGQELEELEEEHELEDELEGQELEDELDEGQELELEEVQEQELDDELELELEHFLFFLQEDEEMLFTISDKEIEKVSELELLFSLLIYIII